MKRFSLSDEEGYQEPLINLTPLIDVVFVVLITFMIIAPMLEVDRVQLAAGSDSLHKEAVRAPLSITVREDNTIWVEGRPIALSELGSWLEKGNRETVPTLIHDKRAQFGTYQAIKNKLEESGFQEMNVLLTP